MRARGRWVGAEATLRAGRAPLLEPLETLETAPRSLRPSVDRGRERLVARELITTPLGRAVAADYHGGDAEQHHPHGE